MQSNPVPRNPVRKPRNPVQVVCALSTRTVKFNTATERRYDQIQDAAREEPRPVLEKNAFRIAAATRLHEFGLRPITLISKVET